MSHPQDARLVAALLRLFPRAFRERFAAEMLATYLDQRAALPAGRRFRLAIRTLLGLVRALPAVRREEGRQRGTLPAGPHLHLPSTPMGNHPADLRLALRRLRTQPGFAAVAILTLALCIGANTAVFSVLNSVILAPLPYEEPERLVRLYTARTDRPDDKQFLTGHDLLDVRDQVAAFSSVSIFYSYREIGVDLTTAAGAAERIQVLPVNAEYFRTFGATPLLGRTFTREEEQPASRVVILSHALWTSLTGRDRAVLGRAIILSGLSYEVIGVMRPGWSDPAGGEVAAWLPHDLRRDAERERLALVPGSNSRQNHYLSAVARLGPGISLAQAQAQVDGLMGRLAREFPTTNEKRVLRVIPLHDDVVGESRSAVFVLMGAAGLVLLIGCLNVANLYLARTVAEGRESAIRTALGARRSQLIRQRLAESVVVALAGGTVGSVVAYAGVKLLLAMSPESLARAEAVRFDPVLLGFALALTLLTGIVFGAAPALRASRADPRDALHEGSSGNSGGRAGSRARSLLAATQVSVALILLVGAGLLIRSFLAQQRVALGFESSGVATFEVHLPAARYDSATRRIDFHARLVDRLAALPGVASAGATSWLPANGDYHIWGYSYTDAAGESQGIDAQVRVIEGDYFESLGIPILEGRRLTPADRRGGEPVAVISKTLARRAYGEASPLGKLFRTGGGNAETRIVGVAGDASATAQGTYLSLVYLPHSQLADNRNWALTYVVRANGEPADLFAAARRELAQADPSLVLHRPRTLESVLARHHARDRFVLALMATFGAIALSLAAVGVYGVLAYLVTQRRHELGIRMALGAAPGQVRGIVVRQAALVAGVGMAIGVAGALGLGGVLGSLALRVSSRDPAVFAAAVFVLAAVILLAGYVPARRATRVDPLEALRRD